jgi:hypothetical protein
LLYIPSSNSRFYLEESGVSEVQLCTFILLDITVVIF